MNNLNEKIKKIFCPDKTSPWMNLRCCGGVALFLGSTLKTRSINTESNSVNYVNQVD